MSPITGFALFFILWWVLLFITLPFGMRTQDDEGEVVLGTVSSAPAKHNIWRKFGINTIFSMVVFGLLWIATEYFGLSIATFDFLGPQS